MLCPHCGTQMCPETASQVWADIRANRAIESATPSSGGAPALPGVSADGREGDPASPGTTGIASVPGEEASPLDRAREVRIVDGMIDLTPIRDFAFALPDRAGVTERLNDQLEELSAILFHVLFRTRTRVSEDWFASHPEPHSPKPRKEKPRKEKPSTDDLLNQL